MFRKAHTDVLELSINGESYVFQSPRDFEFALTGRTSVPAAKIAALSRLPDDELLREAEAIRAVEERFAEALSGALEDITTVGPKLRGMEPSIISQDNGWRSIITALNSVDEIPEGPLRAAFVLNPMTGVIGGFRWALLGQPFPDGYIWISIGVTAVLLACGLFYFKRMERVFADVV